jgi:hypothetical protein
MIEIVVTYNPILKREPDTFNHMLNFNVADTNVKTLVLCNVDKK